MKKLWITFFLAVAMLPSAFATPEVISIEMTDKKMSEVVQIINSICGSAIEVEKLRNPQMSITIDLDNKKCAEVISLIQKFDKSA